MSMQSTTLKTFFVRLQQVVENGQEPTFVSKIHELQLKEKTIDLPGQEPFMLELPTVFEEVIIRWKGPYLTAQARRVREDLIDGGDLPYSPLESDSVKSTNELAQELASHVSMDRLDAAETFTFHFDPEQPKKSKYPQTETIVSGIEKIEGLLFGVKQSLEKHSHQLNVLLAQSERNQSLEKKNASRNSSARPGAKRLFGIHDVLDSTATSPPNLIKKTIPPSPQVQAFSVNDTKNRKPKIALTGLSIALQKLKNTRDKMKCSNIAPGNLSVENPKILGGGSLLVQSKHALSRNKLISGVHPRSKKSQRTPSQIQAHAFSTDPRFTFPCPIGNHQADFSEDLEGDLYTIITDLRRLAPQNIKHPSTQKDPEPSKKYWLLPNPRHLPQIPTSQAP